MFLQCMCGEEIIPSEEILLYRYVKPDCLFHDCDIDWGCKDLIIERVKDFVLVNAFSRENKNGEIENYVSTLFSQKEDRKCRIKDCFDYLNERRDSFPKTFGFIELKIKDIFSFINDEEINIELRIHDCAFCSCSPDEQRVYDKAIHFGLWYIQTEDTSEDEIKTKILECLRGSLFIAKNYKTRLNPDYKLMIGGKRFNL